MQVEIEANKLSLEIKNKKKSISLKSSHTEKISGSCMTEIELSTDIENPTELLNYINKSGVYVAKNKGLISFDGNIIAILAQGQFFEINNLKELYEVVGEELPDEENIITIDIRTFEGEEITIFKCGDDDWDTFISINSMNIDNYVDTSIDTSNLISKDNISAQYGIFLNGNYLTISSATNQEIDSGNNSYKSITPNNIDYAIQSKGKEYFAGKDDLSALQNEIEQILESVVRVNE